jgi:hypothetical protein
MLLNVNHEMHHATKQMLQAIRELLAREEQAVVPAVKSEAAT